jgi:hypothetical protein
VEDGQNDNSFPDAEKCSFDFGFRLDFIFVLSGGYRLTNCLLDSCAHLGVSRAGDQRQLKFPMGDNYFSLSEVS